MSDLYLAKQKGCRHGFSVVLGGLFLILVDSTRNWFYDFASSAGEMELPKSPAAGAIGFRCQRTAVTSTDTAEFVSSTPRTSQNGSSIKGRAIPTQGRSLLKSLCLDEMMPARW